MFFRRKVRVELPPIVVPASAVTVAEDDYELVNAVVQYVKAMVGDGFYLESELDPAAVSAYWVDRYIGEVIAGGHWRYLESMALDTATMLRVQEALEAIGAAPFDRIHQSLIRWVERNRADRRGMSFVAAHRATLDKLDQAFEQGGGARAVARCAAGWIRGVDELKVMRFDEYRREIARLRAANPHAAQRQRDAQVRTLEKAMREPLRVGVGIILGRTHGGDHRPFELAGSTAVSRGADGSMLVWEVRSGHGRFQAVEMPDRVALFERGTDGTRVGVGNLERAKIQIAVDLAERCHAGLAAVTLMEDAGEDGPVSAIVFEGREGWPVRTRFRLLRKGAPDLRLVARRRRVSLVDPADNRVLARTTVSRLDKEAKALAARTD